MVIEENAWSEKGTVPRSDDARGQQGQQLGEGLHPGLGVVDDHQPRRRDLHQGLQTPKVGAFNEQPRQPAAVAQLVAQLHA